MPSLFYDLRYAVRQLLKNPGMTVLVVVTVALGIGANTAVFSLINGFLRPLPVKAPEQLYALAAQVKGDETGFQFSFSYPATVDFRQQAELFSDIFGYSPSIGGLTADGKTDSIFFGAVTGNYFPALGLKPAFGRLFLPGEGEGPGEDLMVVLGHSYWQKRFGGDPGVVGKQVRLNAKPARVVGVVPKGFYGLYAGAEMHAYLPLNSLAVHFSDGNRFFTNRQSRPLSLFGRLKPGVSRQQAQTSMDVLARRLAEQYPASDQGIGIRVVPEMLARPLPLSVVQDAIPLLRAFLLILAGLVLLLACMNVANILMVRATIRQREMAIRAALGSGRGRLLQQTLVESILLAALGGIAGLVLAKWGSDAFAGSIDLATDFPIMLDFSFDWRVFTWAFLAAVSTGIVIGILPALRNSRAQANTVLHEGGRSDSGGRSRGRVRSALVVAQVAGSLVLLVVAGLFARSLHRARGMDLGFDPSHVVNARMDPFHVGYNHPRTRDFYRELERRMRAVPGVQSAAFAFSVPMGYIHDHQPVFPEDRPENPGEQAPVIGCNYVGPGYFETMRIPLVRGRDFTDSDNLDAPHKAIVNQTMAQRFWNNQDPIGKRFRLEKEGPLLEVVGLVKDSKYLVVFERPLPYFYVPIAQTQISMRTLQVRSSIPPEFMASRVLREIQALDPDVPVSDVRTMNQSLAGGFGFLMFRLGAIQGGSMGLLGLILAVIGIYGVVSYGATQRTREIGIRMALGADPSDVRRLVLGQGVRLIVLGIVVGMVVAVAVTRLATRYVMLVSSTDPVTYLLVTLLLAGIALMACYLPARRAMRVDPLEALRHE